MIDKHSEKSGNPDIKDLAPGKDADATPTPPVGKTPPDANERTKPAPSGTEEGEQQDDNIDDEGNKAGGGTLDQTT